MVTEKGYTEHLSCSPETKQLIIKNCTEEFLKENPQFEGMNITHNFILKRIAKHYLH